MTDFILVPGDQPNLDHFILDGVDTSAGPTFTVSQVGSVFFARSSHWVRWIEENHKNVLDGDPQCPHREPFEKTSQTLVDGALKNKKVMSHRSWVEDGVCTRCGGKQVGMRKTATGSRFYTLGDIELMVHALAGGGAISGAQAVNALSAVATVARIHNLIS